jgi:hypothetical protein
MERIYSYKQTVLYLVKQDTRVTKNFNNVFTVAREYSLSRVTQVLSIFSLILVVITVPSHMCQCSPNKTLSRGYRLNFMGIYNILHAEFNNL